MTDTAAQAAEAITDEQVERANRAFLDKIEWDGTITRTQTQALLFHALRPALEAACLPDTKEGDMHFASVSFWREQAKSAEARANAAIAIVERLRTNAFEDDYDEGWDQALVSAIEALRAAQATGGDGQ